jgi:hypothetical protein
MLKIKPWIWLILAIVTLIVRFVYGRKYEILNDEFQITNGGLILVTIAMVFFLLFVFTRAIKSKD